MRITKYRMELDESQYNVLVKEIAKNYESERLDTPCKICGMLNDIFRLNRQAEEHLYMIALDTKSKALGVFEVSHGISNATFCVPREIYTRALLCGAMNIVIAHNHPSGDEFPSKDDVQAFKRMQESGDLLGIPLLDSIIVGKCGYYSFREEGMYTS